MAENAPKPTDAMTAGHETRDLDVRALVGFGVGLVLILLFIFMALRGLLGVFHRQHSAGTAATRISAPPVRGPEPQLQSQPASDFEQFRNRENSNLNTYGWIDRSAGIVRIPIERAMDLIAQRGLPAPAGSSGKTPLQMRQERANAEKPPP